MKTRTRLLQLLVLVSLASMVAITIHMGTRYELIKDSYVLHLTASSRPQHFDVKGDKILYIQPLIGSNKEALICVKATTKRDDICKPLPLEHVLEVQLAPNGEEYLIMDQTLTITRFNLKGHVLGKLSPATDEKNRWHLTWTENGIFFTTSPEYSVDSANEFGNDSIRTWDGESENAVVTIQNPVCDVDEYMSAGETIAYWNWCEDGEDYYVVQRHDLEVTAYTSNNAGKLLSPNMFAYQKTDTTDWSLQAITLEPHITEEQWIVTNPNVGSGDFVIHGQLLAYISYPDGIYYVNTFGNNAIQKLRTPNLDFTENVYNIEVLGNKYIVIGQEGTDIIDIYNIDVPAGTE